ncbi:DUF1569 domain-containing protein [Solitalea koreensis]|uniref:DUF1569 domain-containing protein n=1 Tax=Solitalea koreensis TaxID=543615 RepID=A0A521BL44_9SPHI|nr:DUF1569 domain-containing protein [Solitalea koreensis]SMO47878.1 Protein of unknown function [Solitalea koreensis]
MKSLFKQTDNKELIDRINQLTGTSNSQWGKMNVSQMIAHVQVPMKVAIGEVKLKRGILGILFGGIVKKQLTGPEPFKKKLPTDKRFIVKAQPNFEEEKQKLISLVQSFGKSGETGLTKALHPFFGKLTSQEWDTLMWKHLDHHLRQFGV